MSDGKVDEAYGGITSIPTTFVIDQAGNIRQKYVGYQDKDVFENDIKSLLGTGQ
jgi:peroxiredoxin